MSDPVSGNEIPFRRIHGETALFVISLVLGIVLWLVILFLVASSLPTGLFVLVYVLIVAVIYYGAQAAFTMHVRGNAARLGPDQFPELYERVTTLAGRMGIKRIPVAYLMQAGGALNALASRFLLSNMIVLYSDLMEACGDSDGARDMIIAHELGHVRAGHLRLRWLLLPSLVVPFLGLALSRAREYTCDRIGLSGAGDKEGALLGLSILAVGGKYGPHVSRQALVAQKRDLNTGWMTLGQWFSTHPPLAKRLAALDVSLDPEARSAAGGTLRALSIILGVLVILAGSIFLVARGPVFSLGRLLSFRGQSVTEDSSSAGPAYRIPDTAGEDLAAAFAAIGAVLDKEASSGGSLPDDIDGLYTLWSQKKADEQMPIDPYDGQEIGYERTDDGYKLWSSGPDGASGTDDDITYEGPEH